MPPKKLRPAAKKIIKDIFQAEIFQDWESKWPGVDISQFVKTYRNSISTFHRTWSSQSDELPFAPPTDIPADMVYTGDAAEQIWLKQREKLKMGFFVDQGRGGKDCERAFVERANEATFANLMSKKEKTDGKPPTVKDLADWKWVDDHTAFADVEKAVHARLLGVLVARMLKVAADAEQKGRDALVKVREMEEKEADAAEGGPVVEHDTETKIKQVAEAARLMGNSSFILREIEELWKEEKTE
ncbi:unnamed protein product [Zymoseptoria tritici ST99CH_3D1]|uniref:Uncharacterized protein n=1 Tax=Zymoseptoria tritici (strain ST99CH_3D7) TaxID=1276538 RepID=A0A1X7S8B4_ZYMT9|nr:unnamed protein product [Zymoseptoria tritici ST99CH_3D7]SMR64269.1 unnamed protein product [Zymoseptoria tritici ST99CH_3D1]